VQGKKVDIKTGLPINIADKKKAKAEKKVKQAYDRAEEAVDIVQKLKTPAGAFFIQLIEAQLMLRIAELMKDDPACQPLINIIRGFHYKIDPAQKAVDSLLERFKKNK